MRRISTAWHAHWNLIPLATADTQRKSESQEVQLSTSGIIKGYHHCCFEVNTGELFTACKKRREHGNARLHVGQFIRIIRSPSLKSHYPVFEWQLDTKAKETITVCAYTLYWISRKDSDITII